MARSNETARKAPKAKVGGKKKAAKSASGVKKARKSPKWKSGTVALRSIKKFQKSTKK